MNEIDLHLRGLSLDFALARQIGDLIADRDGDEPLLISWGDCLRGVHSPQCLHCERRGEPGWLVYGRTHGGRLRIGFNDDAIVLIYG